MKVLAVLRRRVEAFPDEAFAAALDEEAAAARAAYARGDVRELYSRGDKLGAVLVLEAPDVAAAEAIVATLPFAQRGMLDIELIPLKPYRGFV